MKTKSKVFLVVAVLFFPALVSADASVTLYIQEANGSVLVNSAFSVPESCTVLDETGASHDFSGHKAPCVIQEAKNTGVIADFVFKNFGEFGLFLDSVNGIASGPAPDFPYWNLWNNGVFSQVGINFITVTDGGALQLTYGPYTTPIAQVAEPGNQGVGGPVVVDVYPRQVNVEQAISFLLVNQKEDGSFGSSFITDWAAVAFGAYKGKSAEAYYAVSSLKEWLRANPVPQGSLVTDYERRAMALMALGMSPYEGNTITTIVESFDGEQFGDKDLVNDDIFAVLVLHNAGYETNVTPLLETLTFILSWQRESGSFGSIDLTAAAIQVLSVFPESKERNAALVKAKEYLATQQENTGGFGNVYATSWSLQAIAALNEDGDSWAMQVDKRTPEHFLALSQAVDGGLLQEDILQNRLWATAYAIPAGLHKSWGDILQNFEKLEPVLIQEVQEPAVVSEVFVNTEQLEQIQKEIALVITQVQELQVQVAQLQTSSLATTQERKSIAVAQEDVSEVLEPVIVSAVQEQISLEDLKAEVVSVVQTESGASQVPVVALAVILGVALFWAFGGVSVFQKWGKPAVPA